jgi:hypothetical protein
MITTAPSGMSASSARVSELTQLEAPMPSLKFSKRMGPVGMALTAWDIWRRIPPAQRRRILQAAREHGPRVARAAAQRGRK